MRKYQFAAVLAFALATIAFAFTIAIVGASVPSQRGARASAPTDGALRPVGDSRASTPVAQWWNTKADQKRRERVCEGASASKFMEAVALNAYLKDQGYAPDATSVRDLLDEVCGS